MHVVVYIGGLRFRNGSSFSQGVFVFVMGLRFRRGLRFRNESSYSQGVFVFVGGLRFRRGSSFSQGVFVFVGGLRFRRGVLGLRFRNYPTLPGKSDYSDINSTHSVLTISHEKVYDNEVMVSFDIDSVHIMCRRSSHERRSEIEQAFEVVRGGQSH